MQHLARQCGIPDPGTLNATTPRYTLQSHVEMSLRVDDLTSGVPDTPIYPPY